MRDSCFLCVFWRISVQSDTLCGFYRRFSVFLHDKKLSFSQRFHKLSVTVAKFFRGSPYQEMSNKNN